MNDKKELEQRCLDLTRDYIATHANNKTRKYINSLIPINNEDFILVPSERPDFVANYQDCSYAIEHFLIDFCNDGVNNNQSESRRANRDVTGIYNKYHDPEVGTIKESDIYDATKDIESEINKISNIPLSFDYEKYVEAFSRVFNHHYSHISDYLSNEALINQNIKVGFLIEFHCDTTLMHANKQNADYIFQGKHRPFPLTKDISDVISDACKLDFVIISQFNEGVCVDSQDVRIYEPNHMNRSIDKQHITIFDRVYYTKIRKNITLNINKDLEK